MDVLWEHTTNRLDPAKYLPIEIVNLIFSFAVYHIVELKRKDTFWSPWSIWSPWGTISFDELIAGFRDGPLILASVSRDWCQIAVNYPPLWSTIVIDQSEDDCLERIHLFLDRSGEGPLDIVLLSGVTPTIHLKDILIENAHRFKTLVGHSAESMFPYSRLEPLEDSNVFVNWSEYTPEGRRISSVPIPKCLHHVQLDRPAFDTGILIQLSTFHNLESLFISTGYTPEDTQWDEMLRFERLRHLNLEITVFFLHEGTILTSLLIGWLECPAIVTLRLFYCLNRGLSEEIYLQLEAYLLRFRSLRKLQVHIMDNQSIDRGPVASRFENTRLSTFHGNLEFVHFITYPGGAWSAAFTERFFAIFVPQTTLGWVYAQFPSPAITPNLKKLHINGTVEGVQSALVAPEMTKLDFPFLEELYLRHREPKWMNFLHAPRLTYLYINGFIPSDLRHITNSIVSTVYLKFQDDHPGPREIFLPPVIKLEVHLQINDIFHLKVHPSKIHAVTISVDWDKRVTCPSYWTMDYISRVLGTVTDIDLQRSRPTNEFQDPLETILPFIKPLVFLKHLKLCPSMPSEPKFIDQLAQHLVDPKFLPKLKDLFISEHPSWPGFFRYIQQRQSGYLIGHFQTALNRITINRLVHGALLEHLRESLAGRYIGLINTPPRHRGSKDWPAQPFDLEELDTDGRLCCYICHKAGLEIGCTISPPATLEKRSRDLEPPGYPRLTMHACGRHKGDWPLNTVFAP